MIRKDDRKLASLVVAGVWMMAISALFVIASLVSLYFFMAAVPLFLIGLGTTGYAVLKGLHTENSGSKVSTPHQLPACKVVARFAVSGIGEMLFNEMDFLEDDPEIKFYVQLQPEYGPKVELKTNYVVWTTCGEGMTGDAVVQGDWLGGFIPRIGDGQGEPHRRDR